jgi:hypothetical protein
MGGTLQSNPAGALVIIVLGAILVGALVWYSRRDRLR